MAETASGPAEKPGLSTFLMIFAFGLLFLVMFDPGLRAGIGRGLGAVLTPLIGFGGRHYAWTIFFAGVILIVLTTVIRHFLVDWISMARTQEVMRTYQKELADARKSNNTYKLKRLMDKQPELLGLQGEMSKSQLKPMIFTMVVVIPLFAWLSTTIYQPVDYDLLYEPGEAGALYFDSDLHSAALLETGDRANLTALVGGRIVPFMIPGGAGPAPVRVFDPRYGEVRHVVEGPEWIPVDWQANLLGNLSAGNHVLTIDDADGAPAVTWRDPVKADESHASRNTLAVLVPNGEGAPRVLVLTGADTTVTVGAGGASLYAVVPVPYEATGSTRLLVDPSGSTANATFEVGTLLNTDGYGEHVTPHQVHMPWNADWDLLGVFLLPRWILLYSLFTIPFGQVTQKALKLWEYRHAAEEHQL